MTTTLGTLFFDTDQPGVPHAVADALRAGGVESAMVGALPRLSGPARSVVRDRVNVAVASLLDVGLDDVLAKAWSTHTSLRAAARATAADPQLEQIVDLASHRITWSQAPQLDVVLGEIAVAKVVIELRLVFDITALAAVVRHGRLTHLRSGRCTVAATVLVQGVTVVERSRDVDLAIAVPLGAGIQLIPEAASEGTPAR